MNRGRNRWLLRVAIPLLVGLALLVWALGRRAQNVLIVENRSQQPIAHLQVTIGEQTRNFEDVRVGAEVAVPIGTKDPSPVRVEAKLANGTLFRGQFGQIPEGAGLVVLPGEIKLRLAGKD